MLLGAALELLVGSTMVLHFAGFGTSYVEWINLQVPVPIAVAGHLGLWAGGIQVSRLAQGGTPASSVMMAQTSRYTDTYSPAPDLLG